MANAIEAIQIAALKKLTFRRKRRSGDLRCLKVRLENVDDFLNGRVGRLAAGMQMVSKPVVGKHQAVEARDASMISL